MPDLTVSNDIDALMQAANDAAARGELGATTVGAALFLVTNPSAITFVRVNADNTVTLLSAADFRTAIGAGTSSFDPASPGAIGGTVAGAGSFTTLSATGLRTVVGGKITTASAMGALAIDVTKAYNTKSISADSTFTFSGTPGTTNQWFGMFVTNTDGSAHTLTIPSSFSIARAGAITSVIIPANGKLMLVWNYDGSVYNLYGDPPLVSGTGSFALTTSPTFVTPVLGTPTSGNLSACTVDGTNLLGYRGAPQNSQATDYTLVLGDAGKCIFHPASDTSPRTYTIPDNGTVAFPVGTIIEVLNMDDDNVTIDITTDTLTWLPAGTTGSRTLAQYGRASLEKIDSTAWIISGNSALT